MLNLRQISLGEAGLYWGSDLSLRKVLGMERGRACSTGVIDLQVVLLLLSADRTMCASSSSSSSKAWLAGWRKWKRKESETSWCSCGSCRSPTSSCHWPDDRSQETRSVEKNIGPAPFSGHFRGNFSNTLPFLCLLNILQNAVTAEGRLPRKAS